jgi:hypothetical protein
MKIQEISKEQIPQLVFPKIDVLQNINDKKERQMKLQQAVQLGNGEKQKAKIIFKNVSGFGFVYTTVWFVSDFHIQLKAGVLMPIASIIDVIL